MTAKTTRWQALVITEDKVRRSGLDVIQHLHGGFWHPVLHLMPTLLQGALEVESHHLVVIDHQDSAHSKEYAGRPSVATAPPCATSGFRVILTPQSNDAAAPQIGSVPSAQVIVYSHSIRMP